MSAQTTIGNPGSIEDINALLADEFVHYVRLQAFHWNVEGSRFLMLHEFFEELYGDSRVFIDEAAERIRSLGARPFATMSDFIANAHLAEGETVMPAERMIGKLIEDREHIVEDLKVYIDRASERGDATIEDFFIARAQAHETALYKLRSFAA